jgi:hypothetical protein
MGMNVQHAQAVANRKIGSPEGWEWFRFEVVDDGILKLTGGVPTINQRGNKKWPKMSLCRTSHVIAAEIDAERERYERETGNCGSCFGEQKEWAGWNLTDGNRYRPCHDCNATGKAETR